jgi:hypothetical protein
MLKTQAEACGHRHFICTYQICGTNQNYHDDILKNFNKVALIDLIDASD